MSHTPPTCTVTCELCGKELIIDLVEMANDTWSIEEALYMHRWDSDETCHTCNEDSTQNKEATPQE